MTIWQSRPLDQVPEVVLEEWRILQTAAGARHLVGLRQSKGTVRVSSAIISIDLASRICVTRSGRKYILDGSPSPGLSETALVWAEWCRENSVDRYFDVTDAVLEGLA